MKRAMDLLLSIAAMVLLTAPLLAVALLIRLCMGAPVLFRQARAGMAGRAFTLYKLRTMAPVAPDPHVPVFENERVTWLGYQLRRWSVDELPQLWNIFKGDMSLVGPRPLLMDYLPLYQEQHRQRHDVRPGLTGWAQIHGRNALNWQEKFDLDVWYVEHQSLLLDLKIIGITFWQFWRPRLRAPCHVNPAKPFQGYQEPCSEKKRS